METKLRSRSDRRPLGQRALGAHRYHRTRAYGARRRLEQRGSMTITRYREVARQHRLGTPIDLLCSLPCCVTTDSWPCGRGTNIALVLPKPNSTWILVPICEVC